MKCVMFHFLVLCLLVLSGCAAPLPAMPAPATAEPLVAETAQRSVAPTMNQHDGCVDSFDPTIDYFPEKLSVTHASGCLERPARAPFA